MIRLGLCCMAPSIVEGDDSYFKTVFFSRFSKLEESQAWEELRCKIVKNLDRTINTVQFCIDRRIQVYRLSSSLFPLVTHPNLPHLKALVKNDPNIAIKIDELSGLIVASEMRVTMHPDQFNVMGSDNVESVNKTIEELSFHGWFMDQLKLSQSHFNPLNLHVNGASGGVSAAAARLKENLKKLPQSVLSRLTFENEDKGCWNTETLYTEVCRPLNIPLCFDFLHHKCNSGGWSEQEGFEKSLETWGDVRPVFHYAESLSELKPTAHSDFCKNCPPYHDYDCELEAKAKDLAILNLRQSHPQLQ